MRTIDYYNKNAESYVNNTKELDLSHIHKKFLPLVKDGGLILDFGCGSGRDSKIFMELGYKVEAIDGSDKVCNLASDFLGIPVGCVNFYDFCEVDKYDGVYACASLLHIPYEDISFVLNKIYNALRYNGVFYMSVKIGDSERMQDGKHYTDLTENSARKLFAKTPFSILEIWESGDSVPGRNERWLNIIAKKTA